MTIDDSIAAVRLTPTRHAKLGPGFAQETRRRGLDLLLKVMAIVVLAGGVIVPAAPASDSQDPHWTGTWAAAPSFAEGNTQYTNQTLRLVVHTSLGGNQLRVKFSNTFGSKPLKIGAAHIAFRNVNAKIVVNSDRVLTFSGRPFVEVPVGALVISDPVYLRVAPLIDIAVSVYLPGVSTADTSHIVAQQTSFVAHSHGDFTGAADLPGAGQTSEWDFLTGIDVLDNEPTAAIVAVGDSGTDGIGSTPDSNRRWTNVLAKRLQSDSNHNKISVLNEALTGNRLLHPAPEGISFFGPAALARLDRDVLGQAGVKYLVVLLGLADIGQPGVVAPPAEEVSADDVIAGLLQLIERAREKGVVVYGCTITPFQNSLLGPGFYTPEKELKREEVNHWIRTSGAYDAVIDFDKVIRDPTHPKRILPAFDSGDHTHPNDAGYKAMGQAIDLNLFMLENQ
jgi:lysophospholipase L1-like esterase